MRKLFAALLTVAAFVGLNACSDDDPKPSPGGNNSVDTLKGIYSNKEQIKLTAGKTYYINGIVVFRAGSSLTIDPGVVVKGIYGTKATIVISRGAKIDAEGEVNKPIVFTSNKPKGQRAKGDWGGIVLCGYANVNSTDPTTNKKERKVEGFQTGEVALDDILGGGTNDEDNSGIIKYVRIEFAGIALSNEANSELNSLTMVAVGRGTTIDYVQSSHGGDDAFEWFGGTVNAKHLVSFRGLDDDFDTDNGYTGKVQFGLSIRDEKVDDGAANGSSNGFESDNDVAGSDLTPLTAPTFSNMTIIGPYAINGGATVPTTNAFKRGAHIRLNSRLALYNSVIVGFPTGVLLDGDKTVTAATTSALEIKNTYIGVAPKGRAVIALSTGSPIVFDILNWLNTPARGNDLALAGIADYKFAKMTGELKEIDARPVAGSPLLEKAAFVDTRVATGFDKVTYIGAFSVGDTWTNTWTNWDPNNADY